jgi:peptidoglycan/LPS O-acetylase OafA/YrhL
MHTHERRAEIQALRAFAVLAVIVFHAWPRVLPGGYLGVDVFFVISGFLITGLLLDELALSGRIAPVAFWARRARRLLPAAFLTLVVCTAATVLIVPRPFWQPFLREIAASATYFENWRLSADAIDYHAAGRLASPVKHFWSLSVEEQFYVLWPLLILAAAGLAVVASRHLRWVSPRRAVGSVLAAATLTSLAWAIVRTGQDPTRSDYSTFTRAWEFGAGGLLALSALRVRGPVATAVGSWLGLLAIGAATLVIDAGAAVPGAAALVPVCGTLLVIACGMPAARFGPAALLRPRLVQLTGDISYSAYLWHCPRRVRKRSRLTTGQ